MLEVTEAVTQVWGAGRVGIRLSPLNSFNSMRDSNPGQIVSYLASKLDTMNLAYLHMIRADFYGIQSGDVLTLARKNFRGVIIGNTGYEVQEAAASIQSGLLDAIAFGHHYVSNPDLVERIRSGRAFTEPDESTSFTNDARGYIDYGS
jgi:N-ethylmaleimide reductase